MIKTYFVDGDKGGVGKTTVARYVADTFINAEAYGYKAPEMIYVIDADPSNADVCGAGGYVNEEVNGIQVFAIQHPIRVANDWIEVINSIEEHVGDKQEKDIKIVFSLPAAAGLVILENQDIAAMMDYLNGTQIWVLGNEESSVQALQRRVEGLPALYEKGVAVRNLKHGSADSFRAWNNSSLKADLFNEELGNSWKEVDFLVMQQAVMLDVGKTPIHKAAATKEGQDGKVLGLGTHISLKTFRANTGKKLAEVLIGEQDE